LLLASAYDCAEAFDHLILPIDSVNAASTRWHTTEALDGLDLGHKIVVEGQFFALGYLSSCNKDDMCLSVDGRVLADQVGLARVVNVASLASIESCINDELFVQAEEVAVTDAKFIVSNLSLISYGVSDLLADVLNDDLLWVERLAGEQAVPVDLADPDFYELWTLLRGPVLHRRINIVALVRLHVGEVAAPVALPSDTSWLDLILFLFVLPSCSISAWNELALCVS